MTNENLNEIIELIDSLQSGLVEIFDQFRELRRRLKIAEKEGDIDEISRLISKRKTSKQSASESGRSEPAADSVPDTQVPAVSSKKPPTEAIHEVKEPLEDFVEVPDEPAFPVKTPESGSAIAEARVARVLDPIAHELRTGEAPAEVIAEYLQAAKDYLQGDGSLNEKVKRDMNVVLRFLRARGKRGIRPEERDNILKRIKRWRIHLSSGR